MEILAMEKEALDVKPEQFAHYLKIGARQVWELYQKGLIREFYFHQEQSQAILMLECTSAEEASRTLDSLPLVQAGLITFDLIPLIPYPGFSRLFVQD